MKTMKFKTNINCGGCVAKIKPTLDNNNEIISWDVDTLHPDKILTINTNILSHLEIEEIIKRTGFKVESYS